MKMKIEKIVGWKAIVVLLEAIVILYSVLIFFRSNQTYYFEGSSLISKYGIFVEDFMDLYGDGFYLDSSLHADAEDLSEDQNELDLMTVESPAVDLKRGSYKVTINYLVGDGEETYTASADYNTWPVITERTGVKFAEDQTEVTYELRSSIGIKGYKVTANFEDAIFLFVHSIKIEETNDWKNVNLILVLLVIFLLDFIYLYYNRVPEQKKRSFRIWISAFGILILFSSMPLLSIYQKAGHDLLFHLYRIEGIKNALLDGQFPVRVPYSWLNGYGYAVSIFYGDSFLYFPAVLRIIGFTVQGAYKAYVLVINIATILVSYYCFDKIIKDRKIAFAGCTVYSLAPYRLLCTYLRCSVGEYTAMLFLPLVLYGLYRIYEETDKKVKWLPLVIGFSGLIQCHVISTLLATIFTALFCLARLKETFQWKNFKQLLIAVFAVIIIDFWFLVPFLDYFRFDYYSTELTALGNTNAQGTYPVKLFTLFPRGAGDAYSVAKGVGVTGEMSYPLGAAFGVVGVCYLFYLLSRKDIEKKDKIIKIGNCALIGGCIATFMACVWFPWDFIQEMFNGKFAMIVQNIQFPWRMLGTATLLFSVVFMCLIVKLRESDDKKIARVFGLSVIALFFISASYFYSDNEERRWSLYLQEEADIEKSDSNANAVMGGEYLLKGTDRDCWQDTDVWSEGKLSTLDYRREGGSSFVTCQNGGEAETYVDIPVFCYKGYRAKDVQTKEGFLIVSGEQNRIRVIIPAGYNGTIKIRFCEPWYWRVSELISVIGVIMIFICFKKNRDTRKREAVSNV